MIVLDKPINRKDFDVLYLQDEEMRLNNQLDMLEYSGTYVSKQMEKDLEDELIHIWLEQRKLAN